MKDIVVRIGFALIMGVPALASDLVLHSGPTQVALIELFTSEGCSSCPPAERWLGDLRTDAGLWREFVPVAFHVNYWDHLGWRDALATKAFTDRQHRYAAAWGAASVYTPGFVRNGREWQPRGGLGRTAAAPEAGRLTLAWNATRGTASLQFAPAIAAKSPELEVTVALLGSGIVSQVRKGENAGRELHHDFVVLRLESAPLARQAAESLSANVTLPSRTDIATSRYALAAWVHARGENTPLQAVGGWIE